MWSESLFIELLAYMLVSLVFSYSYEIVNAYAYVNIWKFIWLLRRFAY